MSDSNNDGLNEMIVLLIRALLNDTITTAREAFIRVTDFATHLHPNQDNPDQSARTLTSTEYLNNTTDRTSGGFSNLQCKLLAPYVTHYRPRLKIESNVETTDSRYNRTQSHQVYLQAQNRENDAQEMGFLDCSRNPVLSKCYFAVKTLDTDMSPYGVCSNSRVPPSLQKLLDRISQTQERMLSAAQGVDAVVSTGCKPDTVRRRLVVLYAAEDGNCLTHSISRCLCGSQILFHALRVNLHHRLRCDQEKIAADNGKRYFLSASDFLIEMRYKALISSALPQSNEGGLAGFLGDEHLFILANILRRPILLLDHLALDQNSGLNAGLFLPLRHDINSDEIQQATRKVLVISWYSPVHFVPVVPIQGLRALIHYSCLPTDGAHNPLVYGLPREGLCPPESVQEVQALRETWLRHYTVHENGQPFIEVGGDDDEASGPDGRTAVWQRWHEAMEERFREVTRVPSEVVNRFCRTVIRSEGMILPAYNRIDTPIVLDAVVREVRSVLQEQSPAADQQRDSGKRGQGSTATPPDASGDEPSSAAKVQCTEAARGAKAQAQPRAADTDRDLAVELALGDGEGELLLTEGQLVRMVQMLGGDKAGSDLSKAVGVMRRKGWRRAVLVHLRASGLTALIGVGADGALDGIFPPPAARTMYSLAAAWLAQSPAGGLGSPTAPGASSSRSRDSGREGTAAVLPPPASDSESRPVEGPGAGGVQVAGGGDCGGTGGSSVVAAKDPAEARDSDDDAAAAAAAIAPAAVAVIAKTVADGLVGKAGEEDGGSPSESRSMEEDGEEEEDDVLQRAILLSLENLALPPAAAARNNSDTQLTD